MIRVIPVLIGADVAIQQPHFAGLDDAVRIFQVDPALARRFDFRSRQDETGLESFDDFVIMKGLPIDGDFLHGLRCGMPAGFEKTG